MRPLILALAVCLLSLDSFAQEKQLPEVYAMMVFNLTKYVQWPDYADKGEFVIGVFGNDEVFKNLNASYAGKPRGAKTYVIKKFKHLSEVTECHVLFIDRSKAGEFDELATKFKTSKTLMITDKEGLGAKGSGINFKTVDNKLKFELNQKVIDAMNLKVSSTLTSMAIII